jgi:quinol monooxygenase YgiN
VDEVPLLVIAGIVKIDPARRDEVVEASIAVMQEARKQPGCISYVISLDLEDPSVLHLFEEWQSDETHRAHVANPHVEAARIRSGNLGMREVTFQRYEIASVGPIV